METLKAIRMRKSTRKFKPELISEQELETILYAGSIAPIGMGKYDLLHITAIKDKKLIDKITKITAETLEKPNMTPFYNAPIVIVVSSKTGITRKNSEFYNVSTVVENMLLAATDLGIGSVYILSCVDVLQQNKEILSDLQLPVDEGFLPYVAVALGYPESPLDEEKPLDKKIKVNYIS